MKTQIKMGLPPYRTAGSCLQGLMSVGVTYKDLVAIFGNPPSTFEGRKTRVEWRGTVNGNVFTIYDYKCQNILLESVTGNYWHIGGFKPAVAPDIIKYVTAKLKEVTQNENTD